MRSGSLKQIGRLPRFFNPSQKQTINDSEIGLLEIWPGYKASSYVYNSGVFLVLESINKFCRTESCYEKIKQM
jgi:protein involved in sex pheromone biosynthesis